MTRKNNTNSDTSVIDKKKEETKNEISKSVGSYWSLIIIIIISLVLIIFYFCISSAILYSCKVSQSNIIPTSMDCFPFTRDKPDIQEIYTNIFITNTDPQESVKLKFPYNDKNSKNLILDAFRNYKNSPKANSIVIYIISIFMKRQTLIKHYKSILDTILILFLKNHYVVKKINLILFRLYF